MKAVFLGRTIQDSNWTIWERKPQEDPNSPESLTPFSVIDEGQAVLNLNEYSILDQGQGNIDLSQYAIVEQKF